jgi:hypothetical protein
MFDFFEDRKNQKLHDPQMPMMVMMMKENLKNVDHHMKRNQACSLVIFLPHDLSYMIEYDPDSPTPIPRRRSFRFLLYFA